MCTIPPQNHITSRSNIIGTELQAPALKSIIRACVFQFNHLFDKNERYYNITIKIKIFRDWNNIRLK